MAGTVTVASKLPFPLRLQLQKANVVTEEIPGIGIRERKRWNAVGDSIIINGCAVDRERPSEKQVVAGAALTFGVDAEFWGEWEAWAKENFEPYKRGLIFANEKQASVISEAKELADEKSGFEPADPKNLPDEFKANIEQRA